MIKNLIIQYGQCENNCSYCYLNKFNIKRDDIKFFKNIHKINSVENLYISYQGQKYDTIYEKIINKIEHKKLFININEKDYIYLNPFLRDIHESCNITISISNVYNPFYLLNNSIYINNNNIDKIIKKLKYNHNQYKHFNYYLSIEKSEPLNLLKLFQLYEITSENIELDSCYKRILNYGKCKDLFVLNEDGNIYRCPYNIDYKDNNFRNKPIECPYIKFRRKNEYS